LIEHEKSYGKRNTVVAARRADPGHYHSWFGLSLVVIRTPARAINRLSCSPRGFQFVPLRPARGSKSNSQPAITERGFAAFGVKSNNLEENPMKRFLLGTAIATLLAGAAMAATPMMRSVPRDSLTVTDWYKQPVYDRSNNKLGSVDDVLVGRSGRIDALVIGVGGFLGAGEKDIAVPFDAVRPSMNDGKLNLTLDATKDELKSAQGLKYDKNKNTWIADSDQGGSR
jgi:sporulation protein YlmC with PRC-barrel domain